MKVLYFFFCYAHIPAQLRQKLAPRANRCFLKGHASAQKGSRCFDPSSRSRRPGMLPSMSTSSSTPPYFSRRLLDQHLLDLLHQWFFLRLPCIRGSQSPKERRQPSIEQPALAPRSSNNKEQPASLSSSSNDQLPTDSPSSSIAAEPSPSLRLNGSPLQQRKSSFSKLGPGHSTKKDDP